MKNIGITGQSGFVGSQLYNTIRLFPDKFNIVQFNKSFYADEKLLDDFVSKCDVIVHMAGVNRSSDPDLIYSTNIFLSQKLVESLERTAAVPHVIFASSIQEGRDNVYGRSKLKARLLLVEWAKKSGANFSGILIPNVYGPFCSPFYNSVIATFSYQLTHNEVPKINTDAELDLIYVTELIDFIIALFVDGKTGDEILVPHTYNIHVSEILSTLEMFNEKYLNNKIIPELKNQFELNLFNTFRSYIEIDQYYPVKYKIHGDSRGVFAELVRLDKNMSGQFSFSSTIPGITRGNHFHTRKIERFAVVRGEALIQLRRVGQDKIYNLYLSGKEPAYVDMPVWTIHNIKNIGKEDLYTIFWINELYDQNDPDTFFEVI